MENFFIYIENNFLYKDWIFFGFILGIIFFIKIIEARKNIKRYGSTPVFITFQVYILLLSYATILIFGMSKLIAGVLLVMFVLFLLLERCGLRIKFEICKTLNGTKHEREK